MASDIFRNIIEQKVDIFASTFGDGATNIFTRDNKLIHPLEYGMYKERCARELLSFVADNNIGISDGFIITADNNVSTQCDIVMYRNEVIPLIDNGITNFYPIEIVKGIGEVKSTLDKSAFSKALVKLAKNKMMFEQRKGSPTSPIRKFREEDEIFSFLICNKLAFNIDEIDFDEIYKDIPDLKFRHNIILSLQDGVIAYRLIFSQLPEKQKEYALTRGVNLNSSPVVWYWPHHTESGACYKCDIMFKKIDPKDKYGHIMTFLISIRFLLKNIYEYHFDLVEYLQSYRSTIFDKEE